ncbi:MAG: hypothetical protein E5299_00801 [Burkholderia gladioli]|nr:MAG: hypothetical protein E5299_00801 [Burkholderia gladioli]
MVVKAAAPESPRGSRPESWPAVRRGSHALNESGHRKLVASALEKFTFPVTRHEVVVDLGWTHVDADYVWNAPRTDRCRLSVADAYFDAGAGRQAVHGAAHHAVEHRWHCQSFREKRAGSGPQGKWQSSLATTGACASVERGYPREIESGANFSGGRAIFRLVLREVWAIRE